ncbi:FAD-dependent oxidoreductase [Alloiococcus sp. CFN-8]|uniref:FAD-dependent oxidoreductase n=1 Tax=Alloiococcus sp. CFN-8 TaxID=3416081 RepID=UPI003CF907D6
MKNLSRKIFCALLCIFMTIGLAACSQSGAEGAYKAGTYKATEKGHNGEIEIQVKFDKDAILEVKPLEHSESAGLGDVAMEKISKEVVEGQTLAVDTVSGATVSSKAILAAIEDCVEQAGGDVAALKAKTGAGDKNQTEEEITTDVVVIGAGGSGLSAATSARQNGAEVIVLEKQATIGGSTALSGGAIGATGTKFQKEQGIEDSKENWMSLWKERQATSNPDSKYPDYNFVDYFMDEAVKTTEWLVDYVGHKYVSIIGFGMDPAERLHFPFSDETTKGGTSLINNIEGFAVGEGVKVLTERPATELIVDEDGNVTGVISEGKNGKLTVHAKKVILAAGGYAKNEELLERFIPEAAGTSELSAAAAGSTGDGMLMAEKVGATFYEDPWVIGLGVASKLEGTASLMMDWSKVYVNGNGERFTNEQIHYAIASNKLLEQDKTWVIIDSTEANEALVQALEGQLSTGEVVKADTFEALAKAMEVPEENFLKTMETYNEGAKNGKDALGKEKEYLVAVEKAPYYALKLYGKTMGTFAGVKTNESFQVLKEDGSIINNLYAVGENANKVLYNQVYMTGSSIQFALTSGRIAGEHAANSLK